jgi:putative intracellular protease/amidase
VSRVTTARTLGAIFYEGFELLDVYGPLEMFGSLGPDLLRIVSVAERPGAVASAQGPQTLATHGFDDCPQLDLLLLPGGIGTLAQLGNAKLLEFLRERAGRAELTLSVCTGSALLARAGLLDGRRATSNKVFFSLARSQSDRVEWIEKARWVEDGRFVTSSGVSAGIDMSLAVIAKLYGDERARLVAEMTEYEWQSDPSRDPFHRFLNQGAARLAQLAN